jgi:positive regulator of sigma E activity
MLFDEEITEEGIVESVSSGTVQVRIARKEACEGCNAKAFCASGSDNNIVTASAAGSVEAGDMVRISLPGKNITSASTYMYGIPLLLLLAGMLLGSIILGDNNELLITLFSLLIVVLYGGFFYFYLKKKDLSSLMPRIIFVKK